MAKQLAVIDGADEGRIFSLSEGSALIGNSRKNTDICLHDLLCARVHCEVTVSGDKVVVRDIENATGTLVNGQKIPGEQELRPGDVIRVGNSYLRLQVGDLPAAAPAAKSAEATTESTAASQPEGPVKAPYLPFERLEELVGHQLSHYRLDGVLGRGYYGVVFRARDLKDDHAVAFRVIHPDFPQTDAEMQRFVSSLKAALPFRHAHLVNVWSAGKAHKYCWLAVQYVEGESVAQILQRTQPDRKIDWLRGFRVAVHGARALEYIHRHNQFHGNVTPRNMLVQTSDKMTKLGDMMLGKALADSAVQRKIFESKFLAELPFMAPEQVSTDAYVDHLSDIYSLGSVVYTLLTGKPPFVAGSVEDTIALIQQSAPTRPRKTQISIPDAFEKIVLRMLAKRQEDRYQKAAELLTELQQVAQEEEVTTV